jgi:Spy/CpxP family protein refolding chaperone
MGQMREEQFKLQQLYHSDKQDPGAIGAQYKRVQDLNRQMVELSADTQNRIEGILKPEQRQQVRRYWRGGMMWGW